jgi:hypothetical protein
MDWFTFPLAVVLLLFLASVKAEDVSSNNKLTMEITDGQKQDLQLLIQKNLRERSSDKATCQGTNQACWWLIDCCSKNCVWFTCRDAKLGEGEVCAYQWDCQDGLYCSLGLRCAKKIETCPDCYCTSDAACKNNICAWGQCRPDRNCAARSYNCDHLANKCCDGLTCSGGDFYTSAKCT